jgi:hypothetical protein
VLGLDAALAAAQPSGGALFFQAFENVAHAGRIASTAG